MNLIKTISRGTRVAKSAVGKHSQEILTAFSIAGMVTTAFLAAKAMPKAMRLIEEKQDEKKSELTKLEVAKAGYKPFLPAIFTGVCSAGCMIGATSIGLKRTAGLAAALQFSQTALSDYKDKVIETIGKKQEQEISDKVAKTRIEKNPVGKSEIIITGAGDVLCMDSISGRYFRTSVEKLKRAENEINRELVYDMYAALNEFYELIGLSPTSQGDILGWNLDDGMLELGFSSQLNENDEPCLVIDYTIAPRYDFSKLS